MEVIDGREILEYAPLLYPLPTFYFNHILYIGKNCYRHDAGDIVDGDKLASREVIKSDL